MENLAASMMVILTTGIIIVVIFLLFNRSKRENEAKLKSTGKAAHGWTYERIQERLVWGYRLGSLRWKLEALGSQIQRQFPGSFPDDGHPNYADSCASTHLAWENSPDRTTPGKHS